MLLALFIGDSPSIRAQWWADAGLPVDLPNQVTQIYNDTVNDALYFIGYLVDNFQQPEQAMHFAKYKAGAWEVSAPFSNIVLTVVNYHDTLFAGGFFDTVDGDTIHNITYNVNGEWQPCGELNDVVYRLRIVDGTLYALGGFTVANGELCNGVARWHGGQWQSMGLLPATFNMVRDIVRFNDELVVAGTISNIDGIHHNIFHLVNGVWSPLGGGILGGFAAANPLIVYKNELYVGGLIDIFDGNAGHGIMRWDGQAWHSLGTGIQDESNSYNYTIQAGAFQVRDDLLYVGGSFDYAGNIPANRTATWDGNQWCSLGGNFGDGPVGALSFFHDTLFVGCFTEADGEPVNYAARFVAPAFEHNCSVSMGVESNEESESGSALLLDLGGGWYTINMIRADGDLSVLNNMGALVCKRSLHWSERGSEAFRLDGLAAGIYVLEVEGAQRLKFFK